ncbi:UNVERIFIED_CONTAM: Retrovirus-related Pol polyprotein from transposon RE1 [Sesamum radiatum]|uniref:Retrovirus-related Pol polyprotein from transposon RE1 n=1 Tax=Sesamum radiatum TaxID=300843 RepID=A0AAW2S5V8_SESRA
MDPPKGFIELNLGRFASSKDRCMALNRPLDNRIRSSYLSSWSSILFSPTMSMVYSSSVHSLSSMPYWFYVDDILLTGSSDTALHPVKDYLDQLFTIKDLGQAKYFLGLELAHLSHGIHITQLKYLQDILVDTSMVIAKPAPTQFLSSLKLVLEEGALLSDPSRYRKLIGRL